MESFCSMNYVRGKGYINNFNLLRAYEPIYFTLQLSSPFVCPSVPMCNCCLPPLMPVHVFLERYPICYNKILICQRAG